MRKNGGRRCCRARSDRSDALLDFVLHGVERRAVEAEQMVLAVGADGVAFGEDAAGADPDSRAPCGRPGSSWPSRSARPARRARDWCRAAAGRRRRSARPPCPRAAANGSIAPCRRAEIRAGRSSAPGWCRAHSDCRAIGGARLRGRDDSIARSNRLRQSMRCRSARCRVIPTVTRTLALARQHAARCQISAVIFNAGAKD